jgi:hypothetical protein
MCSYDLQVELCGNAHLIMAAYALFFQKTNFKMLKNRRKYRHVYLLILCAYTKFHEKTNIFHGLCKKDKDKPSKKDYFSIRFCLFTWIT